MTGPFFALLALCLVPVWGIPHLATQDGPSHLANAAILRSLLAGDCPVVGDVFAVRAKLFPNWGASLLLTGLSAVFSPLVAEKIVQTTCVAGVALGFRALVRAIDPIAAPLSLGVFALVFSYPFLMGFYGFTLGLAASMALVAFWLAHARALSASHVAILAAGATLTFFLHPLPFLFAGLCIAVLAASLARAESADGGLVDAVARRAGPPLLAFVPGMLLFLVYLATGHASGAGHSLSVGAAAVSLLTNQALVAYGPVELVFSTIFTVVLGVGVAAAVRRPAPSAHPLGAGLLALWILFAAGVFAVPDWGVLGGYVHDRVLLLFDIVALLWIATRRFSARGAALLAVGLALAAAGLGLAKVAALRPVNDDLDEYLTAARRVEVGRRFVPLNFLPGNRLRHGEPSLRVDPLLHASGYAAAEACVVSLDNYEAGYTDHFPTRFRDGLNPYALAGYDESAPERFDPLRYAERAEAPVDYVLVWGADEAAARNGPPLAAAIEARMAEIRRDFEPVFRTARTGRGELFRRRGLGAAGAGS